MIMILGIITKSNTHNGEIQRTEKVMHDMNLREDTDRGMPRIDALNWVLNEMLVLKREDVSINSKRFSI